MAEDTATRDEPSRRQEEPRELHEGRRPEGPSDLGPRNWWGVVKRTAKEFQADNLTDWAAALTYYSILAIFPALIALVSILGLIGDSVTQDLLSNLEEVATPSAGTDIITGAIEQMSSSSAAGLALILGIAGALWSASGYVGGFMRASNSIYEIEEGRPFWKLRPVQIAITALMIVLLALSAIAVVVSGPLAEQVGNLVGAGDTAVTVWDIAKWPVIVVVVATMIALLYYLAPNVKQPSFRWVTVGSGLAVILWILASAGFAFYVSNFSSYNETYGSLAGVIVFLVWLWITNLAILFGAELDAELERERELTSGVPHEETIALEPRQAPKEK